MKNINDQNGCFIVIIAAMFVFCAIIIAGMVTGTLDDLLRFVQQK